ncbi:hypothetical protein ACGFYF_37725 [Streptomyces lavendulae]|uniref:hypothetical protein n=1 Tax=Streptomyces lavendulae TaxID=1914 RepID=UPI003721F4E2
MAYEVIRAEFRTELHARWSVFFDHLRVPWAYEPVTFYDSQGSPRTPAFWLPEQRMWFAAELEAPVWWGRFAMAAEGSDYWGDGWAEQAGRCLPVEVPVLCRFHWKRSAQCPTGWATRLPDAGIGTGSILCHVNKTPIVALEGRGDGRGGPVPVLRDDQVGFAGAG